MKFVKFIKNSILGFCFNDLSLDYIDENITWKYSLFVSWGVLIFFSMMFILTSIYTQISSFMDHIGLVVGVGLYPLLVFGLIWIVDLILSLFGGIGRMLNTIKFSTTIAVFPVIITFSIMTLLLFISQDLWDSMSYIVLTTFYFWILILILKVFSIIYNMSKVGVFSAIILILFVLLVLFAIGLILVLFVLNGFTFELETQSVVESIDLIKLEGSAIYLLNDETRTVYLSRVTIENSSCGVFQSFSLAEGLNIVDLTCDDEVLTVGETYSVSLNDGVGRSEFNIQVLE